jgi:hypothetical protein
MMVTSSRVLDHSTVDPEWGNMPVPHARRRRDHSMHHRVTVNDSTETDPQGSDVTTFVEPLLRVCRLRGIWIYAALRTTNVGRDHPFVACHRHTVNLILLFPRHPRHGLMIFGRNQFHNFHSSLSHLRLRRRGWLRLSLRDRRGQKNLSESLHRSNLGICRTRNSDLMIS